MKDSYNRNPPVDRDEEHGGTPCPGEDILAQFAIGRLPPGEFDEVADHVSNCGTCSNTLSRLDDTTDTLLVQLRVYLSHDADNSEGLCGHLPDDGLDNLDSPEGRIRPWIQAIGPYDVQELIGRGGMGVVFKARQRGLGRIVAIKTLDRITLMEPESVARFRTEAQAIGRLKHPNIVQVHEYGELDARPYLCMEYVAGPTLAHVLAAATMSQRDAAQIMHTIALAIDYAHSRQVLHRDLKPSNVLMGQDGIKVTDFGLAKLLDGENDNTTSGQILGTAGYMSPEQARGDVLCTSPRTDVYGLGAILYEMLTGHPPFHGRTRDDTLRQVQSQPLVLPRTFNRRLSQSLEAICLKCLHKHPDQRYSSAKSVAEDLERWLLGGRVAANRRIIGYLSPRIILRTAIAVLTIVTLLTGAIVAEHFSSSGRLRAVQSALARGESVTLIQSTGEPRYYHVPVGQKQSKLTTSADGCFSIVAGETCIVLLIDDPQGSRFRLTADVRHDKGELRSEVGIVLAYHSSSAPPFSHNTFIQLAYNDVESTNQIPRRLSNVVALPELLGNQVTILPRSFGDKAEGKPFDMRASIVPGHLFTPAGFMGGDWHRIEIDVDADEISGVWDGHAVGTLSKAAIDANMHSGLSRIVDNTRLSSCCDIRARGAVGLIVHRGTASFRNVTIQPKISHLGAGEYNGQERISESK